MTSSKPFPASSIVNWYVEAESMLINVLQFIPYCDEHKNVWSPKLITILQETCSQLDSLWRHEIDPDNKDLDIKDYCSQFGERIRPKWLLFWGEKAEIVQPFKNWDAGKPARSLQ